MSIYVRELLCELANGSLDVDSKVDLVVALQDLYSTRQIQYADIVILNKYIQGYSCIEIANWLEAGQYGATYAPEFIAERIVATLALVEETSQYTDETIIQQGLRIYPKYRKTVDAFRNKCMELSRYV